MRQISLRIALAMALCGCGSATALASSLNFDLGFQLSLDCDQPQQMRDVPVRGAATGSLNSDRTGALDLTLTTLTTNTIHFDAKLGGRSTRAPGGSTRMRILSGNRLQAIWELPNDDIVVTVKVGAQNCTSSVDFKLKHGNTQYSLFDGHSFFFCSRPRVVSQNCSLK